MPAKAHPLGALSAGYGHDGCGEFSSPRSLEMVMGQFQLVGSRAHEKQGSRKDAKKEDLKSEISNLKSSLRLCGNSLVLFEIDSLPAVWKALRFAADPCPPTWIAPGLSPNQPLRDSFFPAAAFVLSV